MPPDTQPGAPSDIADPGLAEAGRARIGWAQRGMPVLRLITERYAGEYPELVRCAKIMGEVLVGDEAPDPEVKEADGERGSER